jgi:DNA-dependent protein kinase catalytic subunit
MYNPVHIMAEELGHNMTIRSFLGEVLNVLQDEEKERWRDERYREVCPDVSVQVAYLIDMATDVNILGRQWVGMGLHC